MNKPIENHMVLASPATHIVLDYAIPPSLQTAANIANAKVSAMTPLELHDIVDLSDVTPVPDRSFVAQWRLQVASCLIDNAMDGEEWALDVIGDEA